MRRLLWLNDETYKRLAREAVRRNVTVEELLEWVLSYSDRMGSARSDGESRS